MDNTTSEAHELMMGMLRRRKGWSIIDNAANLIGHIAEKSDEFRTSVINGLWEASDRLAKEIGLTATLTKAFDISALSTIEQAGRAAEHHAEALYISYRFGEEKNASHAFYSDNIARMAAFSYAAQHQVFKEKIERGESKILDDAASMRERGNDNVHRSVWEMAERAAKAKEKQYGLHELGPWDDFEWGMINGKLSALRWVFGDEWDMLDT
jgi:hypothetical protein